MCDLRRCFTRWHFLVPLFCCPVTRADRILSDAVCHVDPLVPPGTTKQAFRCPFGAAFDHFTSSSTVVLSLWLPLRWRIIFFSQLKVCLLSSNSRGMAISDRSVFFAHFVASYCSYPVFILFVFVGLFPAVTALCNCVVCVKIGFESVAWGFWS